MISSHTLHITTWPSPSSGECDLDQGDQRPAQGVEAVPCADPRHGGCHGPGRSLQEDGLQHRAPPQACWAPGGEGAGRA